MGLLMFSFSAMGNHKRKERIDGTWFVRTSCVLVSLLNRSTELVRDLFTVTWQHVTSLLVKTEL